MISITGDAVHKWYYIEGVDTENQSWSGIISRSFSDGTYTLYAYGNDSDVNEVQTGVTFIIDTPSPATAPMISTTTQETTSEMATTTSLPAIGDFPGMLTVLLLFGSVVVFTRRKKRE